MHASIEELLSLRDDEGTGGDDARKHVSACRRCSAELERLHALRARLRALPEHRPPTDLWAVVEREAYSPPAPRDARWMGIAGALALAAAVALVAMIAPGIHDPGSVPATPLPARSAMPVAMPAEVRSTLADTSALMQRSQRLEATLRALAPRPEVVNLGTASTIAMLEQHLALVDYQISLAATEPLPAEQSRRLWQRRVELMDSLVNVRYAQLRRADF